jgi:hypothetical protein
MNKKKSHLPMVYQLINILLDRPHTFTCGLSANIPVHSHRWAKKHLPVVYQLIYKCTFSLKSKRKTNLPVVYQLIYILLDGEKHLPVVYQLIYILLDGKKHLPVVYQLIYILLDGKNIYLWFIN